MTREDRQFDPVLDALSRLPDRDVSPRRAERLRQRCHAHLRLHEAPLEPSAWIRVISPALLGFWGVAYFFATLWRFAHALAP
jgi:hypothetical protein